MRSKIIILSIFLLVALIVLLPPILHKDAYIVLNNDTLAHLEAFERLKYGGEGLYLGQTITGKVLVWWESFTGMSLATSFMWFNYISLYLAGVCVALMVWQLTRNKVISVVALPLTIFGCYSVLHLFYCGTIYNIIGVMIILPLSIIGAQAVYRKYKLCGLVLFVIPCAVFAWYFHPALGSGITWSSNISEGVINPLEAMVTYFGIFNMVILAVCIGYYVDKKFQSDKYQKGIIIFLLITTIASFIIAYIGATPYSSRVVINAFIFIALMMYVLMGIISKYDTSKLPVLGVSILAVLAIMPSLINWISNCIVKGIPANEILS